MRTRTRSLVTALALLLAAACTNAGSDRLLSVSAKGIVAGFTYFDADGSLSLNSGDDSLANIGLKLVSAADTTVTIATAHSTVSGRFRFTDVPVGVYVVRADTTTLGDSVRVSKVDSATVTVLPSESLFVNVGIGYPAVSIAKARTLPAGKKVFVTGVAMNAPLTFADTTVHFADTSGSIRLTRVRVAFGAGDSLRLRATTGRRLGQATLDDPKAITLGQGLLPTAAALTTAAAASAGTAGARDAQLASVHGAVISDTSRTSLSFILTVSDGSGTLEIQLDRTADAAFQSSSLPGPYIPGASFDVLGLLTPTGSGTWRLRPRNSADLTEIPPPVLSIAAVRALPAGRLVYVVGVALNNSAAFSDTTVHIFDRTGSIRLTRLRTAITAGDSVKVKATTGSRAGQPTLDDVTSTPLGRGLFPTAAALTTAAATTGDGATRDAQLASVHGATISDTATVQNDFKLTVSDGSGNLEVLLDHTADAAFQPSSLPGPYIPGASFDALGLLVPTGTGTWRLKPRSATDLTVIPPPVLSVAAARALPAGRIVIVVGVALNNSTTYTDTTVSLADGTGAIRLTRLRSSIAAGDSVRVRATTGSRAGQPTLDDVTSTSLGRGLFPTAAQLTTAAAATGAAGARDAQLAQVRGAVISDTATVQGDFRLTVSDSSGNLEVLLDHSADPTFQPSQLPGQFIPGNKYDVLGILVPTGTAGAWRLKPRSATDLTVIPPPVLSIAAVRALPAGRIVVVAGVALNSSTTFSDTTVSLADNTGSIRLTRLRSSVAAGDSVRVRATTSSRTGQPTLDDATLTALGRGLFPTAVSLTTAAAATASAGASDAQLVVVRGASISDTATVQGNFRLTVTDGSGSLEVLLDATADVAFTHVQLPGVFIPLNRFDIVGILQPVSAGVWRLKPRSAADLRRL